MGLYPKERERVAIKDYERVPVGKFVNAEIEEIQYEENHNFKGEHARVGEAVRIKFKIEGCKYPHGTTWMSFNYDKKSNLFNRFLLPLVADATPYMKFDLKELEGFKVRMIWLNNPNDPNYQSIQLILPADDKKLIPAAMRPVVTPKKVAPVPSAINSLVNSLSDTEPAYEEEVPF